MTLALSKTTFREIASVGEDALLHTAMLLGLKGDRRSLTALFQAAAEDGPGPLMRNVDPMTFHLRLMAHDEELVMNAMILGKAEPPMHAMTHLVKAATFQSAVAVALSRDPDETAQDACVSDLSRLEQLEEPVAEHFLRCPWTEDHGALLAAAIDVWRPEEAAHTARHLHALLQAAVHMVNHPGAVQTFIDAGLDERELWPDPLFHEDSVHHPFIDAIQNHNFEGARLLLGAVKSPGRIFDFGRMVVEMSHMTRDARAPWTQVGRAMATETFARSEDQDPHRPLAIEALALIDAMHDKVNDPVAMTMRSALLTSYLIECDKEDCRADEAIVDHLLRATPTDRMSLSNCLSDWPQRRHDLNHVDRLSGNVRKLVVAGLELRAVAVVEAGSPMIAVGLNEPGIFGASVRALQHLCGPSGHRIDASDLKRCLKLLDKIGYPVKSAFDIEAQTIGESTPWRTSVLDLLASHNHEDQVAAMVAALELGCPSQLKNHRGRTPTTAMSNPGRKDQWNHIHLSYLSSKAARDALTEIGLGAPELRSKGP